ncbi:MAG TPA: hypothetical protein DGG95_15055 [Cytophagales bacterium]|nr:hypothetical protein [Cytophagales bacterium]
MIILSFCLHSLHAQQYFFKQYRVENGLPSDIVKSCTQDSLGYLWIATDEGLVKYDGIKFTSHREAMHSNFAKGFYKTKNGRLLAYGDLDLIEITNLGDTVLFKSLCHVGRNAVDSTIAYPKAVYEDFNNNIWVSESQAVVKLVGKNFKRYNFDLNNRSPQYLRSFGYFEDMQKNLFVCSFQGNVFKYNSSTDQFDPYSTNFPSEVEFVSVFEDQLFIGHAGGLSIAHLLPTGGFEKMEHRIKTPFVSNVSLYHGHDYFLATRGTDHFIYNSDKNSVTSIQHPINNINSTFVSGEGDLWISGNEGLILMKQNLIQSASQNLKSFIETIEEDAINKKIYYAINTTLYEYDLKTQTNKVELFQPNGYFQSLVNTTQGLWIANAFKVFLYSEGKIKTQFDFSKDGRFVTNMSLDSQGNLWLAEPGNPDAYMIDLNLKLNRFNIPLGNEGTINLIREGPDGYYIASSGKSSYLFYKSTSDNEFKNVSVPVKFKTHGDFNVTDLAFIDKKIWMATSEGLLKYDGEHVEQLEIDESFKNMPVKSVKAYDGNKLLLTNALGLILYDVSSGAYDLFNESAGLLSNTITPRGLVVGKDETIWLGTSEGLCFTTKPLTNSLQTPRPRFIEVKANGKNIRMKSGIEFEYGSFLLFQVSSITFPEKEVKTEYKFESEKNWHSATGNEISFSKLNPGKYSMEVRTKKNGPYAWSNVTKINFQIAKPFWQRTWFYILVAVLATTLVILAIFLAHLINKKRNEELQLLISKRTKELQNTNDELAHRNDELDRFVYSASHDLSAPLKSILGLISIAKLEKPSESMENYLDLMKQSILKLESFIKDIISYSRNTRIEIKKEAIDFDVLIQSIWADLLFTPDAGKIKFEIINELKSTLISDETRLRIIFNNVLSNAIKFRSNDRNSFIKVTASENDRFYNFSIQDNGMGISKEYKSKIFEMFFRANENVQGSGLGLYILKETVAKLNGTVSVESELNFGTTFKIQLPK